ncbi:hypothetical protein BDY17DRAFT_326250 [Neohortaea acidophila]|uniref:Xylanolytic transcriptional activator regulatory domain-containing protein n=1 Tax=Neohortaea acidophila TaxID=245834 RepID=A0A6A6PNC2_9PEZI|nr:uncharacterized protein BDY17DRAFT_326250 [Neohortaea acidophila]KAF2481569.1 hypothetical protein BDY17DRAFT_326250 [Neohortaea acidophila]
MTSYAGTGVQPCKDCVRLEKECIYAIPQRRKRKAQDAVPYRSDSNRPLEHIASHRNLVDFQSSSAPRAQNFFRSPRPTERPTLFPLDETEPSGISNAQDIGVEGASGFDPSLAASPLPKRNATSAEDANWQYHEPWSWTSILSDTGTEWVERRTGDGDFAAVAKTFSKVLVQRGSFGDYVLAESGESEISESTAWKYTNAFYEHSWEANLGFIDRKDLETHLKAYYRSPDQQIEYAWFALRNTVFACGYRGLLAKDPSVSFATAQAQAGRFFKAALSVLTNILIQPSNLVGVRALALMACYAEGLGSPAFKHLLCANAVHLAQSKGLHRQPDRAWASSEGEKNKRLWLWWALYALEKEYALFDGRPSAIHDGDISAQIPTTPATGGKNHTLSIGVRCAMIQSQISQRLLSIQALTLSLPELIGTVSHFDAQLKQLLDEIPAECRIGPLTKPIHSTRRMVELLFLHCSIYGTIMAVHSQFFYPWTTSRFATGGANAVLEAQIAASDSTVADAARNIILGLRLVSADVSTPGWLSFQFPLYAAINLFIYILKYPALETAAADLGLLDVCAGAFGYIEFSTQSQVSVSFPSEIASIAREMIRTCRGKLWKAADAGDAAAIDADTGPRTGNVGDVDFDSNLGLSDVGMGAEVPNFPHVGSEEWNFLSSFDLMNGGDAGFNDFLSQPLTFGDDAV